MLFLDLARPLLPGDLLRIEVRGDIRRSGIFRVGSGGEIHLPGGVKIRVLGQRLEAAAERVRSSLGQHRPVELKLISPASNTAQITGAVRWTGARFIGDGRWLAELVADLEPNPDADLERIAIEPFRGETLELPVSANFIVRAGDRVEIRRAARKEISVLGAVGRPGSVPFQLGMRVRDAVATAGAVDANSVVLERFGVPARSLRLDSDEELRPGDLIRVLAVVSERFTISGAVRRTGLLPIRAESTLVQALAVAGGVLPSADVSRIEIRRRGSPDRLRVDLREVAAGRAPNPKVGPGDTIWVPQRNPR